MPHLGEDRRERVGRNTGAVLDRELGLARLLPLEQALEGTCRGIKELAQPGLRRCVSAMRAFCVERRGFFFYLSCVTAIPHRASA
jgi:hypothetical protein